MPSHSDLTHRIHLLDYLEFLTAVFHRFPDPTTPWMHRNAQLFYQVIQGYNKLYPVDYLPKPFQMHLPFELLSNNPSHNLMRQQDHHKSYPLGVDNNLYKVHYHSHSYVLPE